MYLNPGTGSIIIQALLGLVVSIPVLLLVFRRGLKAIIKGIIGRNEKTT